MRQAPGEQPQAMDEGPGAEWVGAEACLGLVSACQQTRGHSNRVGTLGEVSGGGVQSHMQSDGISLQRHTSPALNDGYVAEFYGATASRGRRNSWVEELLSTLGTVQGWTLHCA